MLLPHARFISRIHSHALLRSRRFSSSPSPSSSSSSSFPSDHSFTSKHVARDGRVFQFATVVINNMGKDQSALPAWEDACSLVNANPPTLAIVLLSKSTDSALSAVRDIADQFARSIDDVATSHDHGTHADASCHAQCTGPNTRADASYHARHMDPLHHTHPVNGSKPACICNAHGEAQNFAPRKDNQSSFMEASYSASMPSSTTSMPTLPGENAFPRVESQLASVPPLIGCIVADQERVALTTSIIQANTETGDDLLWLDAPSDEGRDLSPGGEEGNGGSRIGGDKSGVVWQDSSVENPVTENRTQITNLEPRPSTVAEVPADSSTQKTPFQHTGDNRSQNDNESAHDSDKIIVKENETYRLSLCVANMPGVTATSFYTRTAGLPWLPDLANAVTTNNPHMLLLSAPGFNVAEFNQRLACMFPNGSRAGASLLTINDGKFKGSTDDKAAQIFCGSKLTSTGAVGLSLSPAGEADFIPVDAFAEFVRMSLGMPHGSCWDIYFDEAVCESLFLPQRGRVEWLDTFQRAYKVNPDSVLEKMYTKLHNECRDATSFNEPRTQLSKAKSEKLSIISVDKILFPGFFIPLFIENPCDRLMVRQCMEECRPFGVSSLCTQTSLGPVDCRDIVGTIVNMKVNLFDKGCKSYIIAHGVRRFRVKNGRLDMQPGTFGQLAGQVEFLDDVKFEDDNEKKEVMELANRALNLCQHLFPFAASILSPGKPFEDPIIASFAISHILPVSVEVKRRWLGMVNTKYRLVEQISFLNA